MLYGYGKHGECYCRCECECGNECLKASYDLRHPRNPPHCGCLTDYYKKIQSRKGRYDLTGQRFGRLTVTGMIYEDGKMSRAICKCDCGNEIVRPITYLTTGDTTSCGCYHRDRTSESNTKDFTGIVAESGIEFLYPDYKRPPGQWMWRCRCGVCGSTFTTLPANVLDGTTISCGCSSQSKGEFYVESVLKTIETDYIREYKIDVGLPKNNGNHYLWIDFYIPDQNKCIEYNGRQHYEPVDHFGGQERFELQKEYDHLKKAYCVEHNMPLLELPYTLSKEEIRKKVTNFIYPERLSCPM